MDSDFLMLPTWHSLIDVTVPELPCPDGAGQSPADFFFSPSFRDKSTEASDGLMFDSAPGSLTSNTSNEGSLIRELIGKMGSSGEKSPRVHNPGQENAPKWGHYHASPHMNPAGFTDLSTAMLPSLVGARSFRGRTSQFTELAAMGRMLSRTSSSPALRPLGSPPVGAFDEGNKSLHLQPPALNDRVELSNSWEDSHSTEAGARSPADASWRKIKPSPRGKEAETEDGSAMKRARHSDENGSVKAEEEREGYDEDEKLQVKAEAAKPPPQAEPPKDYIHVRARRGQATDSHSLAERVRREKISERMKILQDLVPGCNKVTGKALMLDEIINYVQSLQRQVEFLSMKLASVNSMDTNTTKAKDGLFQPESTDPEQSLPISSSALLGQKNPAVSVSNMAVPQYSPDPLTNTQFLQGFFHGDDLQRIVHMGFGQN
ncbi:hypothetical protein SAY86_006155 [Trapa natans]|uniref:BHLH domain-containing protein n=1 Tax=Trapa natans TaxID=22666 RepID=A0AAN7LDF0_TRANT|nr:hypothetical protein SAY86_006155 [Trapa natans]